MNSYEIAGLKINMTCSGKTAKQAEPYRSTVPFEHPDLELSVTREQLEALKQKHDDSQLEDWEYFVLSNRFASSVLQFNGMLLHASAVVLNGQAYLFSAPSGTGKSTHTAIWCNVFPGAFILNDDKPVIRLFEGQFFACGTPWSGKTDSSTNLCVPLKAICVLKRGLENNIRTLSPKESLPLLFRQTLRGTSRAKMETLLALLDQLLTSIPVYELACLPNEEAARLAQDVMSR